MRTHRVRRLLLQLFVLQAAVVSAQINPGTETGLPPNSTFHGGDVDVVNVQNGNLHISIPIVSIKQRGGKNLTWKLLYDTPGWSKTFVSNGCTSPCTPPGTYSVAALPGPNGWRLSSPFGWTVDAVESALITCQSGTPFQYQTLTNFAVTDPEGTQHPLPLREEFSKTCLGQLKKGPAVDGSGIFYDDTTGLITLKDGTQFVANSTIQDTNGNQATSAADTLNRNPLTTTNGPTTTFTTPLGATISGPQYVLYTISDPNGNQQNYRLDYQAYDYHTDLCSSGDLDPCFEQSGRWLLISKITLPNGTAYSFTYNNNTAGQLASMTLPTGAVVSYTYSSLLFVQHPIIPKQPLNYAGRDGVTSRTETVGGVASQWTYSGGAITDPLGNVETHSFAFLSFGSTSNSTTTSEYETQVTYADPSGHVLRTVSKTYAAEVNSNLGVLNVRPITETTLLDNGVQKQTQTDYETFQPACSGAPMCPLTVTRMNPTEVREYDYGTANSGAPGPLLRKTDYTYLHTGNSTYTNLNIVNRVTSVTTFDGAGSKVAQTNYEFDNYSHSGLAMTASSAIQHASSFSTSYTTRGNETAISHWRNTDNTFLTTVNQFDDAGNLIASTDPLGNKITYDFTDSWANATCAPSSGQGKAYITKITNALGQNTSSTYNSCTADIAATTDANAQTTSLTYDLMGRLIQTNHPDGGQTSLCYSDNPSASCYSSSLPLTVTRNELISTSPALSRTDVGVYDGLGRLTETKLTSDPEGTTYTRTSFDLDGRKSQEWNPTRCDPFANPSSCSGETTFGVTTYNYDALGRVIQVIPPDGTSSADFSSTSYSGASTTVTDEAGHSRTSQVDGLGRLISVNEDPSGLNYQTLYQYNALGNLTCVEQHGSATTGTGCSSAPSNDATSPWRVRRFTYNSLSQLLAASNPESGTISYAYDNNGNVHTKIAPSPNQTGTNTVTTTYTYDALNRLTGKTYADTFTSNPATAPVDYAYDGNSLPSCPAQPPPGDTDPYPIGHRSSMCDFSGATNWTHDKMGRINQEKRTIGGAAGKVDTDVYNLDGSVASMTVLGYNIAYTYNGAGRAVSAINPGTTNTNFATNAKYAPFGGPKSATWGAGTSAITIADSYNSRLQPITLSATTPAATIMSLTYDFHLGTADNGNIFKITNNRDSNRTQNFLYDSLNRISQAYTNGSNWGETYGPTATAPGTAPSVSGIDAWGNLINRSGVTGKGLYEPLSTTATLQNRLTGYGYDAAGNMISNGSATYVYDAENRLIATGGQSYKYDGDGKRVEKCTESTPGACTSNATATKYWMGWTDEVSVETDLPGNVIANYIFFDGERIARRDAATGAIHYYFSDHLGSHSLVTDVNGTMPPQEESDFYPYGGEIPITTGDTNHYKFTGKERDAESGLDNFGARYDASSLGRFMTPDWAAKPVTVPYANFGDPQTLNLYAYVENAPINRADADGHQEPQSQPAPKPCGGNRDTMDPNSNATTCQSSLTTPSDQTIAAKEMTVAKKQQTEATEEQAAQPNDPNTINTKPPTPAPPADALQKTEYPTKDAAAKAAEERILDKSLHEGFEYGFRGYQNPDGTYSTTAARTDHNPVSVHIPPVSDLPPGTRNAFRGHTHPNVPGYDHEHFSPADKRNARHEHVPSYLGTAEHRYKRYDPSAPIDHRITTLGVIP